MLDGLLKWFFPYKCIVCGTLLGEGLTYFCSMCQERTEYRDVCGRCGKFYVLGGRCKQCEQLVDEIICVRSVFPYVDRFKESVLRWKYTGIRRYSRGYAELIVADLMGRDFSMVDVIVPIPIAPNRLRRRGFNQALDLACEVGRLTGLPVLDVLKRTRSTKPQSACSREERFQNIRDTIICHHTFSDITFMNILFIDDIYTTGSTIRECMRAIERIDNSMVQRNFYVVTVCMG